MMKIYYVIFILFLSLLFPYHTHAISQVLRVSPIIIPISIIPGKTITETITIENLQDTAIPVEAAIEDFDAEDEETGFTAKISSITSPLTKWITIDPSDMIIDSRQKKNVTLTITVPPQVAVGGYTAAIYLTPVMSSPSESPRVIPRIAVLLLANLGIPDSDPKNRAAIESMSIPPFGMANSTVQSSIRVKNTSLTYFTAKPILEFIPVTAKHGTTVEFPEKIILPGKIRRFSSSIPVPALGWYSATMRLSLGEGQEIRKTQFFISLPEPKTLIFPGIGISVLFLFIYRKRLAKAVRVLVRG